MLQMFDKQLTLRMGQANVRRWVDDILPLLSATTTRSASTTSPPTTCRSTEAPQAYEMFQKKQDGAFKVVFTAVSFAHESTRRGTLVPEGRRRAQGRQGRAAAARLSGLASRQAAAPREVSAAT